MIANSTFETVSGSVYEIDHPNYKIRRVSGNHPPTERQGSDGEWQTFLSLGPTGGPVVGQGLLVIWDADGRMTYTSTVTKVVR